MPAPHDGARQRRRHDPAPIDYVPSKEDAMLNPKDEADLSEAIAGVKGPLAIIGGGTRRLGNPVQGEALTTSGLSGISLYEPGALTLVAKAGTPVAEVEAALAAEGQMLPFEPMDHRALQGSEGEPTIGGVVAANVSGPRRVQAGACRDSLIGVRFVDGGGTIVKNGGRVMKNVTGYDLVKLLAGSYGSLGVLSEVSFKVLPKPDSVVSVVVRGLDGQGAIAAMSTALGSPFGVSGAAHARGETRLRLEGLEASVKYRAGEVRNLLSDLGEAEIEEGAATEDRWRALRDASCFAGKATVWRVSIKASDAAAMVEALTGQFDCEAFFDWGGGLVWIGAEDGNADLHAALQNFVGQTGGHATLVKGPEELRAAVPVFQPEVAALAKLSEGLRSKFDPRGILNPGVMG